MKLNVTAPVNSLGYGQVGQNILLALRQLRHDVAWFPIGDIICDRSKAVIFKELQGNQGTYSEHAPSVRIWHQFDLAQHVGRNKHVAWPFFELDKFTPREKIHLNQQDMIIVSSEWAKEVVINECVEHTEDTVFVVPCGVDGGTFPEAPMPDSDVTTFLVIGKWEYRKGHDAVKKAFEEAFRPDDKVRLIMHCHNPCIGGVEGDQYNKQWVDYYDESPLKEKILISKNRPQDQANVATLMSQADCGVFLSRAEGWNLEVLEMMAMGRHVIATGNTGHMAFCDNCNAHLIPTPNSETAYDGMWFNPNRYTEKPSWARLGPQEISLAAALMRTIHEMKQLGKLELNKCGIETGRKLSWANAAKRLVEVAA